MAVDRTLLAVLTPPGRGAVATVGVRGPRAMEVVGRRFRAAAGRPLAAFGMGRILAGRFQADGGAAEELVVGLVRPQEVEVHCHGGAAAVEAVAAALVAEGAERVEWPAWADLVQADAIAAEAAVALASARTERTAAILLDQQRGALAREVERIAALVQDDPEAPSPRPSPSGSGREELRALLEAADLGRHLTEWWRVVLAGRPNAGKSSLMNAILGYQRSIVHGEPGTTRDVLTGSTAIDGWPVELADTAGLRGSGDAIESEGVERARRQMAAADLVVLVADVTERWSEDEQAVVGGLAGARNSGGSRPPLANSRPPLASRLVVVHNKCDLAAAPNDRRPAGIAVSALTGEGLAELLEAIAGRLVPLPPPAGAAVPFTQRQVRLLAKSLAAVEQGDAEAACKCLARLTSSNSGSQ